MKVGDLVRRRKTRFKWVLPQTKSVAVVVGKDKTYGMELFWIYGDTRLVGRVGKGFVEEQLQIVSSA